MNIFSYTSLAEVPAANLDNSLDSSRFDFGI
jgi:hypothetical protein